MTAGVSRGIRNHNPGNIRHSADKWQGKADEQLDKDFISFKSPKWGIRALARVLISYQDKYDLNTVQKIISRWAPSVENDTRAYVIAVSRSINVMPNESIDVSQYEYMEPLVKAIIKHENGKQPYSQAVIDEGLKLAGVVPDKVSSEAKGTATAAAGVSLTATVSAFQEVQGQLEPLAAYTDTLKWVFLGIAISGVLLTAYARFVKARA